MIILSIETSCDETALSVVEARGGLKAPQFKILANNVASQIEIHKKYGGVFPMLAKREHSKNLIPLLKKTLKEAGFCKSKVKSKKSKVNLKTYPDFVSQNRGSSTQGRDKLTNLQTILEREPELLEQFLDFIPTIEVPKIDAIVVTYGPGLEPALWVGLNFAKALSLAWNKQLTPVNHMEGHVVSALLPEAPIRRMSKLEIIISKILKKKNKPKWKYIRKVYFPALALLISGGHTELVLVKNWMDYVILGETLDDAVGEAFDKVARMLGLPYPGGPAISALAEKAGPPTNNQQPTTKYHLPRPMINSGDYNFSFSGLKTAVLYTLKKIPRVTQEIKAEIAKEFQSAVTEVLVKKTMRAVEEYGIKTLLVGGGVAANTQIRAAFKSKAGSDPALALYFPQKELTTDNSVMIAMAGYFRILGAKKGTVKLPDPHPLRACGTLRL